MGAELTGDEVIAAIAEATSLPATIEMTGGGVATICIGQLETIDCDVVPPQDEHYLLCVGPGTFNWQDEGKSTFYVDDLSVGPDDHGESGGGTVVHSLEELTAAVRRYLSAGDPA